MVKDHDLATSLDLSLDTGQNINTKSLLICPSPQMYEKEYGGGRQMMSNARGAGGSEFPEEWEGEQVTNMFGEVKGSLPGGQKVSENG